MELRKYALLAAVLAMAASGAWAQLPAPDPRATHSVRVEGFDFNANVLAFRNYTHWSESRLPAWAELAHCTSLVLMVRQMFHYAHFEPSAPALSATELEARIRAIYYKPTGSPPEGVDRITIPGYANLRALSASQANAIIFRRVMADAVTDALRPDWYWTPADILRLSRDSNERMEQYIRDTLDRGRVAMLYLARGTNLAHAVLVLGYDDIPGQHRYVIYDPNQPAGPVLITYNPDIRDFHHPTMRSRDGWVLFPYSDMPEQPYPSWVDL